MECRLDILAACLVIAMLIWLRMPPSGPYRAA